MDTAKKIDFAEMKHYKAVRTDPLYPTPPLPDSTTHLLFFRPPPILPIVVRFLTESVRESSEPAGCSPGGATGNYGLDEYFAFGEPGGASF